MRIKKLLATSTVALAALSIGGFAVGAARAGTAPTPKDTAVTSVDADTDNVQEGDQSAPDNANAPKEAEGTESNETAGEAAGEADGPGGHADPAGNVDHQFEGEE